MRTHSSQRRRLLLRAGFAAAIVASHSVSASVVEGSALSAQVQQWRRDFHQYPELGNREFRTSKIVAAHLKSLGLEVKEQVALTGVIGMLRTGRPGKRIILRADMDALPVTERNDLPFRSQVTTEYRGEKVGVMHACGHDAHTAILMGVAASLVAQKDSLNGEIMFMFQPAEEGPPEGEEGGARMMMKQNVPQAFKPDAIIGMHVWAAQHVGKVGYRAGPAMASSDSWTLKVTGKQTHGSMPWGGIDPIVASAQIVQSYQTIVSRQTDISHTPAVLSVGAIKGGVRFNIIPETVEMIGTLRTFDAAQRDDIIHAMQHHAEHIAAASGAKTEYSIFNNATMLINNTELSNKLGAVLQKAMGAENVEAMDYVMAAEDFADFSPVAPLFYYFVGATPKDKALKTIPRNHSPDFYLDEGALDVGVKSMVAVAKELLSDE